MAIRIACNACGQKLQIKEELRQKKVRCPACGGTFYPAAVVSQDVGALHTVRGAFKALKREARSVAAVSGDRKDSLNGLPPELFLRIDEACCRFETAWRTGARPHIEDYLVAADAPEYTALFWELLPLEILYRRRAGESPHSQEYFDRFPFVDRSSLEKQLLSDKFERTTSAKQDVPAPGRQLGQAAEFPLLSSARYQFKKILGQGGFGVVYLAHDEKLQRLVAIKVPHAQLIASANDAQTYLAEARTVANLDHPHIVPVYDVGEAEHCPVFIVSKYIDGCALTQRLKEDPPGLEESVRWTSTIAETLHYAHGQGLVHRDIKPGNILLDKSGIPYVADFGLALKEENIGRGPRFAGTPAYMSPEQARGEGHRVDGRSDIFSLGIVFYELLTGRRPFQGDTQDDLLDKISNLEARPPRQWVDAIPKELERICLKALAKRASERYSTAKDLAEDLQHFANVQTVTSNLGKISGRAKAVPTDASVPLSSPPTPTSLDSKPIKVVPKGLRSFDAHDADFFLELLPGPRDRDGLPDSLRFWKTRIEEADPEASFAVGLIYGPSGCGKTSLIKAGLLPRLAKSVMTVYLESTREDLEARLINSLRHRCPRLPVNLTLKEALTAFRQGEGLPSDKKLLIVLDQFEQWLHAGADRDEQRADANLPELVQALRQCDGVRVQCLVMVRDDFWMSATRFMRDLEIDLAPGRNTAAADLFDLRHARKVLTAFGRAFGALSEKTDVMDKKQKSFIERAIAGLAQDNKVVCVRLALFAEMMKGRVWTPSALKAVGGAEGVGVTFLEETFTSQAAHPKHRLHQKAARAVLKALMPETGSDIKGHSRPRTDLLEASGYRSRRDFDELMAVLDADLRLITPTDLDENQAHGKEKEGKERKAVALHYQLTHDYLVPSLRAWLTRKQRETRRGRAELLLADRASLWNARPENRQLPSTWQWLNIRLLTRKRTWTPPQRKMMRQATRVYALRGAVIALLVCLASWGSYEAQGMLQARVLKDRLLDANITEVPAIVTEMASYRSWINPLLQKAYSDAQSNKESRKQMHAALALLPGDLSQCDYLFGRLLDAGPQEVAVLREALAPYKEKLSEELWSVAEKPEKGRDHQRLRAGYALAGYDPDNPRWQKINQVIAADLVAVPPFFLKTWSDGFRPVTAFLLEPLSKIFRDTRPERTTERTLVTNILIDYIADQPQVLADLLMDADERQFSLILPKFKERAEVGTPFLTAALNRKHTARELNWNVRFYQWGSPIPSKTLGNLIITQPVRPPTDWAAIVQSPLLAEVQVPRLFFNDKTGLPSDKIPLAYFATVATCALALPGDPYSFTVTYDDGIRVWFDDKMVFEDWKIHGESDSFIQVNAEAGRHSIKIEHFQAEGSYALGFDEDPLFELEALAKRQANAAVALLKLDNAEGVWSLLKHSPDPTVRSYIIHHLCRLNTDLDTILKRLDEETEITIRRALILGLGNSDKNAWTEEMRLAFVTKMRNIYLSESDPGMHAAVEWLLRRPEWQQEEWISQVNLDLAKDYELRDKKLDDFNKKQQAKSGSGEGSKVSPQWYVGGQAQTMVVIPGPLEFLMGSPASELGRWPSESQHKRVIPHSFAIATKAVTIQDFLRFRKRNVYRRTTPTDDCPVFCGWTEAAAYCNWLSAQEGIPEKEWCYTSALTPKANYFSLSGYRLPTEAEWEYACRAGAVTKSYFGEATDLLGEYSWYLANSNDCSSPVGRKKPNDFGLFDMHGNVYSWCQDTFADNYPKVKGASKTESDMAISNVIGARSARGGSFNSSELNLRSAYRYWSPSLNNPEIGFRVARTIRPVIDLSEQSATSLTKLGSNFANANQYANAIEAYSKAIEIDPQYVPAWTNRALAYRITGLLANAVADYSKAIELSPSNAANYANRASLFSQMKEYEKAIADYSKLHELSPTNVSYLQNRALAYVNAKQYENAIADYSKLIERNPKAALPWAGRANAHNNLAQFDKAIADFNVAIELSPKDYTYLNNLAWLLATAADDTHRDPHRAVDLAKKAIELSPATKFIAYFNTLGVAHYRAGNWQEARESLETSIDLYKKTKLVGISPGGECIGFQFLAMTHWRLAQKDEARRYYEQASAWLTLNPTLATDEIRRFQAEAAELLGNKK
jgi:serine/threonine protein kinase/formylglycine-generating enzyme required for sulfatase activity/Tfp pilus assembly protein PilF